MVRPAISTAVGGRASSGETSLLDEKRECGGSLQKSLSQGAVLKRKVLFRWHLLGVEEGSYLGVMIMRIMGVPIKKPLKENPCE